MSERYRIDHGDCLELLKREPPNSFDSMITDPPSGISFMSRAWDGDRGGRRQWVQWLTKRLKAAFRVLKPGAHGFVWALPRTCHWTGLAIEEAGFEIRDCLSHAFGSGFPKSTNVEREVARKLCTLPGRHYPNRVPKDDHRPDDHVCPACPESREWLGEGTALKPGHELWFLIRKPLEGTIAENVLKYGTGALFLSGCRVAHASASDLAAHEAQVAAVKARGGSMADSWKNSSDLAGANEVNADGRFPPNLLLTHSAGCKRLGTAAVKANPTWDTPNRDTAPSAFTGGEVSKVRHANGRDGEATADKSYADAGSSSFAMKPGQRRDDAEDVAVWECCDDCPVRLMDQQSGERPNSFRTSRSADHALGMFTHWERGNSLGHADSGTASRFFPQFEWTELDDLAPFYYVAKASRAERDRGLENFAARAAQPDTPNPGGIDKGAKNVHPTGKSVELIRYLCRLTTPPKGRVLDPFLGSGTTMVACVAEGLACVGVELNDTDLEPFVSIGRARLAHALGYSFIPRESLRAVLAPSQRSLFEQETA
ncbi:MAG TPA: DNA methyltransferase [Polyangiaceae bacterium]|nr:DNA methyltransferase [Polyangiaceae bacterium]